MFRTLASRKMAFCTPNFKQVEGAYWFGPVRLWVGGSVRYACIRLRTVKDKVLKFNILAKNSNRPLTFFFFFMRGARWLSGRVSDSGARGRGFETYRRRVVSLSKTLYSPKVLVNYPGSGGSVPT